MWLPLHNTLQCTKLGIASVFCSVLWNWTPNFENVVAPLAVAVVVAVVCTCVCVCVSLNILPQNVDVNVHPTKNEVHFLHEDTVIEAIQRAVDARLLAADSSRTYYMQVNSLTACTLMQKTWGLWSSYVPPLQPFYVPFSGPTRVSWCQKRTSGLYGARED